MRALILDHKTRRFKPFAETIRAAVPDFDVRGCARPPEFGREARADFDLILLHFSVGRMESGIFALAFLDGLFGRRAGGRRAGNLERGYYNLGARVRETGSEATVLVYSGGGLREHRAQLTGYGPRVCLSEHEVLEAGLGASLKRRLGRALEGGDVDVAVLRAGGKSYALSLGLLVLCQGFLAAHLDAGTGLPRHEGGAAAQPDGEVVIALEAMTGRPLAEAALMLARVLPPELREPSAARRLREQVCAAAWWGILGADAFAARVCAELWQDAATPGAELVALRPLLALIEGGRGVEDVSLVARAHNAAHARLNRNYTSSQ